ncbi:kinetoplast-associated protein [Tritrichomonas foetus]|uniref:Kinetoplast-associated protein n=1 Tax=Tritrichomonas foetus TaxID=1144522 RepID=A0A1J4KP93_9EUKA|nr:kinetoplast-associated protein [Tritrichomonas foetus]|eukprot:OHT12922.1 kinetoplast-associated protein [Tritrichomonas foetus]
MSSYRTSSTYKSISSTRSLSKGSKATDNGHSKLEKLHTEAKTILSQKAQEIAQINHAIEQAEEQLGKLRSELSIKNTEMQKYQDQDFQDITNNENQIIEMIEEEQRQELIKIQAKNEEELNRLRDDFQKSLQEAENWAEKHAKSVAAERTAQLDQLRKEVDQMRQTSNEAAFSATQTRTKLYQQSKNVSLQNSQRIQYLEAQLSEIVSVTREEMRDIRAKIEECLAAIDIRNKEHANEITRYEHELAEREAQYNEHLEVLHEQFACEKQRVEQSVNESAKNTEKMQKILKQLEKQHEHQLQTTLKDVEKMKHSIYQARNREDMQMNETKTFISQAQGIQRECQQTEKEIAIVENELRELKDENQELRAELSQLDKAVYSKAYA